jgi:hypothetical protein
MKLEFDPKTHKPTRLTCLTRLSTPSAIQIEPGNYNGFTIKTVGGEERTFLLVSPGLTAIDVTNAFNDGRVRTLR